jgi:hypothetical protein
VAHKNPLLKGMTLFTTVLIALLSWLVGACQPGLDETPSTVTRDTAEALSTPWPAGTLFKGGQGEIYRLMENGLIRRISNWPTYFALGYHADDAIEIPDQVLGDYPIGTLLTRWMTGQVDTNIYYLEEGKRFRVSDVETIEAMGGSLQDVSWVPDAFLESFPQEPDPLPRATPSDYQKDYPKSTAALWADGFLWTANETGLLTRWDVIGQSYKQYRLPGEPVIRTLASSGQAIYAGVEGGDIWQLANDGSQIQVVDNEFGWISAITFDKYQNLWYADVSHFGRADLRYHLGPGLMSLELGQHPRRAGAPGWRPLDSEERVPQPVDEYDTLQDITALTFDHERSILWVGTRSAGLLGYDVLADSWQNYSTFNSNLDDNTIHDLELAPDGTLWLATASGVSSYNNRIWEKHHLGKDLMTEGALSLATAWDNTVWATGERYIARIDPAGTRQVYRTVDNPLLSDRIRLVVLDDEGDPWLIGRRGKIHFDGGIWTAYDADVRRFATFTPAEPPDKIIPPPVDFPLPTTDYVGWLKTWPRPEFDNGRGIHFLQAHQFDAIEAQRQVNRMKGLGMRWTVVHYADHDQLARTAPIFQGAGITVIWRPFVRPYQTYPSWKEDVEFLRSRGLAPYLQLYNEPSLIQEWDNSQPVDQDRFLRNLLPAVRQVYDAGGYVGFQYVNPDWLQLTLKTIKSEGMDHILDRLFFIPHLYGLNHPPGYDEDIHSVLGFLEFATVFEEEIGFVPVMIAGEGGWRPGEGQDNRYPAVSDLLHRDYHVAVFDWFRTNQLPNGETLPDYFFAFCPWLISDPHDPAAWFDSDSGDRSLTSEAVRAIPPFEREFSWNR